MYGQSSPLYDKLYHFKDYGAESERLLAWIRASVPTAARHLDVGCATGRHIEHLQKHFHCEGLDLNPDLLAMARARCPGVSFHLADMRNFNLGARFDVITCLFSAIAMAATTAGALQETIGTLASHLRPGGLLIVEPWFTPEAYRTGTITANTLEEPALKIAWMYHSTTEAATSVLDIHYLVGTPESIDYFRERQILGLFRHQTYLEAFRGAGLEVWHDAAGWGRGMYFGHRR